MRAPDVRLTRRAVCVAVPALAWVPSRAETGVSAREIVVGQTLTLEGGRNAYGVAVAEGAKLYIDAANAAGGVNGRRVVLRVLDDDNKTATAESNARQLIADGAFLLFACIEGGPSTAVAKVASAAAVPLFGPMAGAPTLRRPHLPMVFPLRAEHREEFRALLAHGKSIGMSRAAFAPRSWASTPARPSSPRRSATAWSSRRCCRAPGEASTRSAAGTRPPRSTARPASGATAASKAA